MAKTKRSVRLSPMGNALKGLYEAADTLSREGIDDEEIIRILADYLAAHRDRKMIAERRKQAPKAKTALRKKEDK